MTIQFLDKEFELNNYTQYESIRQSKDLKCECGYSNYLSKNFIMVGYCNTNYGYMGVFECPVCFEKYRHHINTKDRYSEESFKNDVGLVLYLQYNRSK